ncbi:hypothetical protein RJ641_009431 [Dillenia turbinata]|uniref:DUF8040 domain-containing protein n=1 Tax=Dillenia turbinata TaxID=194707 RepID=A0AAN8V038_9MAGN
MDRRRMKILIVMVMMHIQMLNMLAMFCMVIHAFAARRYRRCILLVKSARKSLVRSESLNRIIYESDEECVEQLCMDRHTFAILCTLLRSTGRLKDTRKISVEQQAAMFLQILAHNVKNREIRMQNSWSQETISRHFNAVLVAVLRLHGILFRKPEAVSAISMDAPWKWFKICHMNLLYLLRFAADYRAKHRHKSGSTGKIVEPETKQ